MGGRQPRIEFGGVAWVVASGVTWTGRATNLSVGGAFITSDGRPLRLEVGSRVSLSIELGDGKPAIGAHATVVWTRPRDDGGQSAGVGVRFSRIDEPELQRIAQLVHWRGEKRPARPCGPVRVQLPGLSGRLRTGARAVTSGMMVLDAELSWLKLGTRLSAELSPGDVRDGRLAWVSIDVAPSGHARLCLHVELTDRVVELVAEPEDAEREPTLVTTGFPR